MKAILSCTYDDQYLFNLPFAVYSWHLLGVECVVFLPRNNKTYLRKVLTIIDTLIKACGGIYFQLHTFSCPENKEATYAQCSRLYAAAIPGLENEVLITSDADMCVFNKEFWDYFEHTAWVNIIGVDLVPEGQVPMCYITSPAAGWRVVMKIEGRTYQQCLDDLLGSIEAENFRGNYWGKDQETAYQHIFPSHGPLVQLHNRAYPGTQFATRRADRDGWPDSIPLDIIDAHLPREMKYSQANVEKIHLLFYTMYPHLDHTWIWRYHTEYLKLINL